MKKDIIEIIKEVKRIMVKCHVKDLRGISEEGYMLKKKNDKLIFK